MTVHKQAIPYSELAPTGVVLEGCGRVLHIGLQRGVPTVWYEVSAIGEVRLQPVATGQPTPNHYTGEYVSTTVDDDIGLVYHWYTNPIPVGL